MSATTKEKHVSIESGDTARVFLSSATISRAIIHGPVVNGVAHRLVITINDDGQLGVLDC